MRGEASDIKTYQKMCPGISQQSGNPRLNPNISKIISLRLQTSQMVRLNETLIPIKAIMREGSSKCSDRAKVAVLMRQNEDLSSLAVEVYTTETRQTDG